MHIYKIAFAALI